MHKLVVLRLEGDLDQKGLQVTAEIAPEGKRAEVELHGQLPVMPQLVQCLNNWQTTYRNLDLRFRLQPKEVIHSGTLSKRIKACQASALSLRDCLLSWLDSDAFRNVDKQLREELNKSEQIQIVIRSQDTRLSQLPWHLWDFVERYDQAEISFCTGTFKKQNSRSTVQEPNLKNKVRILAVLGNSNGIDVEVDRAILNQRSDVEVEFLVEPTRQVLNDSLWQQTWDILFFAGHSETKGKQGHIQINAHDQLTLSELKYGLSCAVKKGLSLAIFNSCDGLGLAYELESMQIPQMIVMREPVPDRIAHEFLKNFLQAFSSGSSFHVAVRQAREQLQGFEQDYPCATWLPVIFQNLAELPPSWQELCGRKGCINQEQPVEAEWNNGSQDFPVTPNEDSTHFPSGTTSKGKCIVVEKGKADKDDQPKYRVKFQGSFWSAILYNPIEPQSLSPGDEVKVVGRSGITLLVTPVSSAFTDPPTGDADLPLLSFVPSPKTRSFEQFSQKLGGIFRKWDWIAP